MDTNPDPNDNEVTLLKKFLTLCGTAFNDNDNKNDLLRKLLIASNAAAGEDNAVIHVADSAARYALTEATTANGQWIIQDDTGDVFGVIDNTNLANDSGYCHLGYVTPVNTALLLFRAPRRSAAPSLAIMAPSRAPNRLRLSMADECGQIDGVDQHRRRNKPDLCRSKWRSGKLSPLRQ